MVIVIVVGIIGLIAGALWATQGTRKAEVRFSTEPADARVFVDGEPRRGEPPLAHLSDLTPRTPHVIEVRRAGFRTWTARLSLTPGRS